MPALAKWKVNSLVRPNLFRKVRIDQPVGEKGWTQVRRRHARPVEDALRYPVVARSVAFRIAAGRDLRHVDDCGHTRFLCRLREEGTRLDDARTYRVEKVGRADTLHGGVDGVNVGEIADGDFDSFLSKGGGFLAVLAHVRPHALVHLQKGVNGDAAGTAGDRKSTRLNSSHITISYAVFCLKKNTSIFI